VAITQCNTDIGISGLVGCVCTIGGCVITDGCASGKGSCVGAMEVCDGSIGKLTCCNVVSLWGWTYIPAGVVVVLVVASWCSCQIVRRGSLYQ
jgi:hypothetical protein